MDSAAQRRNGGQALSAAFDMAGIDLAQALPHASNNLFTRYRAGAQDAFLFFDRYPNPPCEPPFANAFFRVAADGVDSTMVVNGSAFVCHRRPAQPTSLFQEISTAVAGGAGLHALPVGDVFEFLRALPSSLHAEGDLQLLMDDQQVSWPVLETIRRSHWLGERQSRAVQQLLSRAAPIYARGRPDWNEIIVPKMSLDDLVRDRSGNIVGLANLQTTPWPLLAGLVLSNLVEIIWHFRRDAGMALGAMRRAQAPLGMDDTLLAALTVDALLAHGYLNVHVYGGNAENLRDLALLVSTIAEAGVNDACE